MPILSGVAARRRPKVITVRYYDGKEQQGPGGRERYDHLPPRSRADELPCGAQR